MTLGPLRTLRAVEIEREAEGPDWLIESLWPHSAVGIVGGQPKAFKTWLALDLAISVASATSCLARYRVRTPGRALVYLAEDALPDVRARIECLARHRRIALEQLDLHIIAEPVLRLDQDSDRHRLTATVQRLQPRLLVLDPLVRLHRLDENSSSEISGLLGYLRELQRVHDVSVVLVHHTSKRSQTRHGQSLRGTSDLHAWTDVGLYLTWHGDRLRLTPELRTARSADPIELRLVADDPETTHLEAQQQSSTRAEDDESALPLSRRILDVLGRQEALRRSELRSALRVNNARLGSALGELERLGLARRCERGWRLATKASPGVPFPTTPGCTRNGTRNDLPGETDPGPAGVQPGKG